MPTAQPFAPYEFPAHVLRMTVDEKGCLAFLQGDGAANYLFARLSLGHANYNALYSLVLSSWINKAAVIATVSRRPAPDTTDAKQVNLLSIQVGNYAESKI